MARTCEHPHCNKSLDNERPNKRYCSQKHKSEAFQIRKGQKSVFGMSGLGSAPQHQPQQGGFMSPMAAGGGTEVFLLQERIKELVKEKQELQADLKEALKKNDSLKEEVATLKTDHAIFKTENQKGSALEGIFSNPEALANMAPILGQVLQGLMQPGGANVAATANQISSDPFTQQVMPLFAEWFSKLNDESKQQIWKLIQHLSNMDESNRKFHIQNIINNLPNGNNKSRSTG